MKITARLRNAVAHSTQNYVVTIPPFPPYGDEMLREFSPNCPEPPNEGAKGEMARLTHSEISLPLSITLATGAGLQDKADLHGPRPPSADFAVAFPHTLDPFRTVDLHRSGPSFSLGETAIDRSSRSRHCQCYGLAV